ncbi:mannosyltransferase putative-domain-containing protein [Obelidium mucronatum]|nr:mannosyltransferase putative-domain-containing protein [Obelidium mucronatum]
MAKLVSGRSVKKGVSVVAIIGCYLFGMLVLGRYFGIFSDNYQLGRQDHMIDWDQIQFLDYLNGELEIKDASLLFGGSLTPKFPDLRHLYQPFDLQSAWNYIHEYSKAAIPSLTVADKERSFLELSRRVRALLIAYKVLHGDRPVKHSFFEDIEAASFFKHIKTRQGSELQQIITNYTRALFPFLENKSLHELHKQFQTKDSSSSSNQTGIVITSGEKHMLFAIHGILSLRNILNCTLPIELHYAGDKDLPHHKAQLISTILSPLGVTTVNLLNHYPSEMRDIQGWSVKPFAILASRFQKVLFMDADVLFFRDPEQPVFQESRLFRETGQLFYHDRTADRQGGGFKYWFHEVVPHASRYSKTLRWPNGLSWHEQEAGVVVLDKSRIGVLVSLLYACKMNSKGLRGETYSHVWGDKETFWLAMEFARVPYRFNAGYSGAVGFRDHVSGKQERVCGNNFHVDEELRPFWWNGGVLRNKGKSLERVMDFEVAAYDSERSMEKWDWETDETPFCLRPMFPQREILPLSKEEKDVGARYIQLYTDITADGWESYLGRL